VKKTNKTTGPLQLGAAPGKGGLAKLDPAPPPAKKARELTASEKALIEVGSKILATPPEEVDKAYQHAILCQVGFPRSKVDGTSFIRRSGSAWLHVQAGVLDEGEGRGPVMQPIPYGPLPRLALARISTYAVMNSTREIPIGESAAEFLRMMGMDRQGNRYRTLRKQMHALAACRLTVGGHGLTHHLPPDGRRSRLNPSPGGADRDLFGLVRQRGACAATALAGCLDPLGEVLQQPA